MPQSGRHCNKENIFHQSVAQIDPFCTLLRYTNTSKHTSRQSLHELTGLFSLQESIARILSIHKRVQFTSMKRKYPSEPPAFDNISLNCRLY